jgi:uncharacterized delta-60 repeat protein
VAFLIGLFLFMPNLFAAEGTIDTSFNSPEGYVLWDGGSGDDFGRDIALQSDGKIVVTGYRKNGTDDDLFVIRYNADGSLDTGFGTNGIYRFDKVGTDWGYGIAIDASGRIVVTGQSSNGTDDDVIILRLDDSDDDSDGDDDEGGDGCFIETIL